MKNEKKQLKKQLISFAHSHTFDLQHKVHIDQVLPKKTKNKIK